MGGLPTQDYVKSVLSMNNLNNLCGITADSRFIETPEDYAQTAVKMSVGEHVLIQAFWHLCSAKIAGRALITSDGETLEGEALEDIAALRIVRYSLTGSIADDCCAVI